MTIWRWVTEGEQGRLDAFQVYRILFLRASGSLMFFESCVILWVASNEELENVIEMTTLTTSDVVVVVVVLGLVEKKELGTRITKEADEPHPHLRYLDAADSASSVVSMRKKTMMEKRKKNFGGRNRMNRMIKEVASRFGVGKMSTRNMTNLPYLQQCCGVTKNLHCLMQARGHL
jgi:hypothetical protein